MLRLIGALLIAGGIAAAFIGPLELYVFYLFSEGGPFYYEGFRFGSFMFANLTIQTGGYYLIAAVCLPLGYGHWKLRRWARASMITLLTTWLVIGLPLSLGLVMLYINTKDVAADAWWIAVPILLLLYPIGPVLMLCFYRSRGVRLTLAASDPAESALEAVPLVVRVLCVLLAFIVLALHAVILLNGVFPLFGWLLDGAQGLLVIALLIVALGVLAWGLAGRRRWAWWSGLGVFGLLALSSTLSGARHTLGDMLLAMNLPPGEMEMFQNIPILDVYPTVLAALPWLVMLAILWMAHAHFRAGSRDGGPGVPAG